MFLKLTQNSQSEISNHNEWLADTPQTYFSRPKNQAVSLPQTIAFGAVLIGIIIWGATAILATFQAQLTNHPERSEFECTGTSEAAS